MKREPEVFKPMSEFDGLYHISNYGRVMSYRYGPHEGRIIRPKKNKSGYVQYIIKYKGQYLSFYAQRRVAEYFIPNPEKLPYVDHKDNNKDNNYFGNLQWITNKENVRKDQADIILCIHTTGRILEASGTRHAAELTSCFRGSVQYSLKKGTVTRNGWKFENKK